MADAVPLLLALLAGIGLGAFYFGALWWSVRGMLTSKRPAASLLASALVRMGVALGGFYLVGAGSWQRMLLCVLGFLIGRGAVSRQVRAATRRPAAKVLHAP